MPTSTVPTSRSAAFVALFRPVTRLGCTARRSLVLALAAALVSMAATTGLASGQDRAGRRAERAPASDAPASDAPASDVPASDAPASDAPASDAPEPDSPEGEGDVDAESREVSEDGEKVKAIRFSGLDVAGRLKSPQLLYFLRRMRAELDRPRLPHRSFMPELERSTHSKSF